jgi:hypothetical protein
VLALLAVGMNTMRGPLLTPDDDFLPALAYTLTCIAAIVMGVALGVRKPKVPERRPGESVEAYWKRPEMASRRSGSGF